MAKIYLKRVQTKKNGESYTCYSINGDLCYFDDGTHCHCTHRYDSGYFPCLGSEVYIQVPAPEEPEKC